MSDTICAISTPIGEGAISIVRLSGPAAIAIAESVVTLQSQATLSDIQSHIVHYGHVVSGGEIIDEVMVCVHRAPRSYTAEDIVEINTHGGIVLTKRVLELLIKAGARLAEPGEFTKRAFLHGRLDLTRAEAVLDVIRAKTDRSLQAAQKQLGGELSNTINDIKQRLVTVLAHIEAGIDFADDEIDHFDATDIQHECEAIVARISHMIDTHQRGSVLREGVHTVLIGKTNVGKSSLLNTLLNRDRAIVSAYPGTTRDALEELIELDGILFRLVDTAGIIKTPRHELDYLSVEKTKQQYEDGDLIVFILDGSRPLDEEDREIFTRIKDKNYLIVVNKSDLASRISQAEVTKWCRSNCKSIHTSVATKEGIPLLEKMLVAYVWQEHPQQNELVIMQVRHKQALENARTYLEHCIELLTHKESTELIACDMRSAMDALRSITGEIYTEEILDVIFSEFCIGK